MKTMTVAMPVNAPAMMMGEPQATANGLVMVRMMMAVRLLRGSLQASRRAVVPRRRTIRCVHL